MKCSIEGCEGAAFCRTWCTKHYQRWLSNGDPEKARAKRGDGEGHINAGGYRMLRKEGVQKLEHVRLAEAAIGRTLPKGVQVHHADSNPANNAPSNLVICPDQAYHRLLHIRTRALEASGNPNYLRCVYCKTYSDPSEMGARSGGGYQHRTCYNAYMRQRRAA